MRRKWTDEDLIRAVESQDTESLAEVMRKLGLIPRGGTYKSIRKHVKRLGLDISHFTGQAHLKGKSHTWAKKIPLDDILKKDTDYPSYKLKKRLIENGHFDYKCYKCGLEDWNDEAIPLELEHINGVNTDNRLENLTLLCPNCHAQTPTYRGRNINPKNTVRYKIEKLPSRIYKEYKCQDCGCEISRSATMCKSCAGKKQKRKVDNRPSRDILIEEVKENGYSATGRKYGVSDNAIRKWLK